MLYFLKGVAAETHLQLTKYTNTDRACSVLEARLRLGFVDDNVCWSNTLVTSERFL